MRSKLRHTLYALFFFTLLGAAGLSLSGGATGAVGAQGQPTQAAMRDCWSVYPGPSNKGYQQLTGVAALSDSDVWAVGFESSFGSQQTTHTIHWDGKGWTTFASPNIEGRNMTLSAVAAVASNDVWAVGSSADAKRTSVNTFTMHWDGKAWSIIPSPNGTGSLNELKGVAAVSKDDVWAVGYHIEAPVPPAQGSGIKHMLIVHWDGTRWTNTPTSNMPPTSELNGISALSKSDVWAAGSIPGQAPQTLVLHWDGAKWSHMPTPSLQRGGILYSISAGEAGNVWAVGQAFSDSTNANPTTTLTMRWNGTDWRIVPSPNANLDVRSSNALNAIAVLPGGQVWAFGSYYQNKTPNQPLLMRWDGSAWGLIPSPVRSTTTSLFGATAASNGSVWAIGSRTTPSGNEGLALRYTNGPCAQTPMPIATMAPPEPLPGNGSITFPETGKTLAALFLEYWKAHGGLPQQGFPISNQMGETSDLNGKTYTMQYFERAVFEYHPENQPPYNVLLSQLGTFEYQKRYGTAGASNQRANTSPGSVLVPETGKRMGGRFLKYWQENGGLPQQGYPISNEFEEASALNGKTYTVQYFERAVFEYHPENQPPYDVLLSHLGKFRYDQQYNGAKSRLIAGNMGDIVSGGKYVFWEDLGLPNRPIFGYDIESSAQFTVTDQPGYKFEIATDGIHVAWVEPQYTLTQSATLNTLHLGTGARSSMPLTRGISGLAVENGVLYYNGDIEDGLAIYAHNIATGNRRPLVVRPFRVLPNGSRTADVLVEDLVVKDGVLLWREGNHDENSPPVNYERSLHMLKLDGTQGDTLLASARATLRSFGVSGSTVVWVFTALDRRDPPGPNERVTMYNIKTRVKTPLSPEGVRASDPIIDGNMVVWAEGTEVLPYEDPGREYHALVKGYDLASGLTYSLFRRNTFVSPRGLSGDKSLVFVQYDAVKDTYDLYVKDLR
jgi:hypothetical protein